LLQQAARAHDGVRGGGVALPADGQAPALDGEPPDADAVIDRLAHVDAGCFADSSFGEDEDVGEGRSGPGALLAQAVERTGDRFGKVGSTLQYLDRARDHLERIVDLMNRAGHQPRGGDRTVEREQHVARG
jgi:hypothetical protein